MVQDTNFKGKYIVTKHDKKSDVVIQSAKILGCADKQYIDNSRVKVRVISTAIQPDGNEPFKIGEIYRMVMWQLDANYDVVDTKLEVITRLL